jgi:hypothetical protein
MADSFQLRPDALLELVLIVLQVLATLPSDVPSPLAAGEALTGELARAGRHTDTDCGADGGNRKRGAAL